MSPTGTSRYEWGSLPPKESEQGACKLQTPSFQAAGRAETASAAADRGRYPCQGPASEEPCEGKLSCTVLKASGGPRGPSLSQLQVNRRQFVQGVGVAGLALLAGGCRPPWQPPPDRVVRIGLLAK